MRPGEILPRKAAPLVKSAAREKPPRGIWLSQALKIASRFVHCLFAVNYFWPGFMTELPV